MTPTTERAVQARAQGTTAKGARKHGQFRARRCGPSGASRSAARTGAAGPPPHRTLIAARQRRAAPGITGRVRVLARTAGRGWCPGQAG